MTTSAPDPAPRDGEHAGCSEAVLSVTELQPDGGHLHQSWAVCGCVAGDLRAVLGVPLHQLLATREQADATGRAVLSVPGIVEL
ncbi:hypothetical protein F5972_08430 [Microbispora cellulosiformans]|uniref:Uncharacterized protein n=1 Tax=Microbispora cellulosiformans TaxID=2614688 RepID=A0A5J5K898_9ACTN|nr:hypothetical protein [Microbispora cellulosiformans]KAA9379669.1 hypothetical protein F5972_08430 [Microbispora cellulosiformans]